MPESPRQVMWVCRRKSGRVGAAAVDRQQIGPDAGLDEVSEDAGAAGESVLGAEFWVVEVCADGGFEGRGVLWGYKQAGLAVEDGVGAAGDAGGDDGEFHGGGFERDVGETFAVGGQDEHVHGGVERGRIAGAAGQMDARIGAQDVFGFGWDGVLGLEGADDQQMRGGVGLADVFPGFDQLEDAFVVNDAADKSDDRGIGGDVESGARLGADFGAEKSGVEASGGIDAVAASGAENGDFVGRAEAFGNGDFAQRGPDGNDLVGDAAGDLFGQGEQEFFAVFGGHQRQAAHVVDALRGAGHGGGQHAEQAALGGVGVDDVGFDLLQQVLDLEERAQVLERRDAARHFDRVDVDAFLFGELVEQRAGGGNGVDFVALSFHEGYLAA